MSRRQYDANDVIAKHDWPQCRVLVDPIGFSSRRFRVVRYIAVVFCLKFVEPPGNTYVSTRWAFYVGGNPTTGGQLEFISNRPARMIENVDTASEKNTPRKPHIDTNTTLQAQTQKK